MVRGAVSQAHDPLGLSLTVDTERHASDDSDPEHLERHSLLRIEAASSTGARHILDKGAETEDPAPIIPSNGDMEAS